MNKVGKRDRLNKIYEAMKRRCYNKKSEKYRLYGGRGITICDEWLSPNRTHKGFNTFKAWALANGYSDNLSIDRINNNKGYSPNNCRWVTSKVQSNNRSINRLVTYKNKTQTLAQWCDELGLNYMTIYIRLFRLNWDVKKAFETKTRSW